MGCKLKDILDDGKRVDRVAQGIPQEVEREDRDDDEDPCSQ